METKGAHLKSLFTLFILALSVHSFSADWKPVAKTVNCPQKVEVFAKTGEKYILLELDGKKHQLHSNKEESYSEDALVSHQFVDSEEKLVVTLPGYVEANPPKFDNKLSAKKVHCRMNLL